MQAQLLELWRQEVPWLRTSFARSTGGEKPWGKAWGNRVVTMASMVYGRFMDVYGRFMDVHHMVDIDLWYIDLYL